jgi:hypothetical protein
MQHGLPAENLLAEEIEYVGGGASIEPSRVTSPSSDEGHAECDSTLACRAIS